MISDKKFEKIEKVLGKEKLASLEGLSVEDLKSAIVASETAMREAKDSLENNPKYQEIKESAKVLSAGLKEVNKFQKNVIEYSLHLLEEKGQQ